MPGYIQRRITLEYNAWDLGATPSFEDDQNCDQASPDSQISTVVVGPSAKSGDAVSWVLL